MRSRLFNLAALLSMLLAAAAAVLWVRSHSAMYAVGWIWTDGTAQVAASLGQLPGRVAGSFGDPVDRAQMIGNTIEFGYSSEVGYRHRNEFAEPRPAS